MSPWIPGRCPRTPSGGRTGRSSGRSAGPGFPASAYMPAISALDTLVPPITLQPGALNVE